MKIEIFDKPQKDDTLRLKLDMNHSGAIRLIAVDASGERIDSGTILTISVENGITLHTGVSEQVKLPKTAGDAIAVRVI